MIADFSSTTRCRLECFDPLETPDHMQFQKFQCCLFVPVPKTRKLETFAAGSLSSEAARGMGRRLVSAF